MKKLDTRLVAFRPEPRRPAPRLGREFNGARPGGKGEFESAFDRRIVLRPSDPHASTGSA